MPPPNLQTNHTTNQTSRRTFIKHSALSAAALAALAASPASALALLARQPEEEIIETILDWTLLQPGFHAIADPSTGGNTLMVVAGAKALLIDTKFPSYGAAIKTDAAAHIKADVTGDRIDVTLINTHHHADHTGGNPLIIPAAAASYAHINAFARIRTQLDRYKQAAKDGPARLQEQGAPDELLRLAKTAASAADTWTENTAVPKIAIDATGNTLTLGDIKVQTHHFGPGHTDNDLVVNFPDHNTIHTGDLVFSGRHPYFDPTGGVNARGWINALKQTLKLTNETTTVIPGHGPIGDRSAIQNQITYLESLINAVQTEINNGAEKDQITQMTWDFMQGLEADSIRPRAIAAVYDELTTPTTPG